MSNSLEDIEKEKKLLEELLDSRNTEIAALSDSNNSLNDEIARFNQVENHIILYYSCMYI